MAHRHAHSLAGLGWLAGGAGDGTRGLGCRRALLRIPALQHTRPLCGGGYFFVLRSATHMRRLPALFSTGLSAIQLMVITWFITSY